MWFSESFSNRSQVKVGDLASVDVTSETSAKLFFQATERTSSVWFYFTNINLKQHKVGYYTTSEYNGNYQTFPAYSKRNMALAALSETIQMIVGVLLFPITFNVSRACHM